MDRIAVFGGSFNPPHYGHMRLIGNISSRYDFDRILVVPSYISPHKLIDGNVKPQQRFEMCKLAFQGSFYEVSDIELSREGKSYSYDTLLQLKEAYNCKLSLIIGSDMLFIFDQWYRYKDILMISDIIAACRQQNLSEYEQLCRKAGQLNQIRSGAVSVCDVEPFQVSSTQIRQMVRNHVDIGNFVPAEVQKYIIDGGLYID